MATSDTVSQMRSRSRTILPMSVRWFRFDWNGCSTLLPPDSTPNAALWSEPPRVQARWADVVCVAQASDPSFNEVQIRAFASVSLFSIVDSINVTGIGNAAYMATSDAVPDAFRERWVSIAKQIRSSSAEETENETDPGDTSYQRVDYFAPGEWLHVSLVVELLGRLRWW